MSECDESESSPTGGIAVASTEVEPFTGVDEAEVPSARWGWSGSITALGIPWD